MASPIPSVLIVDDNPLVRSALRGFLNGRKEFESIAEASNGCEAIERAKQLTPDLIVMDLSMPVMNGIEAAAVIRAEAPFTRIIMFTLYPDAVGRSFAKAAGIDLVLPKESGLTGLTRALDQVLAQSRAMFRSHIE